MDKGFTINVLDKGFVRYIDHLGTDQRILESARISYKAPSKGDIQDKKLLFYLYKNKHTSPFEQCSITFNIKMPIFVMRQFIRHRTFRINEQSARYTEMPDDFYIPTIWRKQDSKSKQSSFVDEDWDKISYKCDTVSKNNLLTQLLEKACQDNYKTYKEMIAAGVAKEMARMILPVNLYTEIYVNCDLHNLLHFTRLRIHPHAQYEIQEYAKAMLNILEELYPWTAQAFKKYSFEAVEKEID